MNTQNSLRPVGAPQIPGTSEEAELLAFFGNFGNHEVVDTGGDVIEMTQIRAANSIQEVEVKKEPGTSDTPIIAREVQGGNKRSAPDIEDLNPRPAQRPRVEGPVLQVGGGQVPVIPQGRGRGQFPGVLVGQGLGMLQGLGRGRGQISGVPQVYMPISPQQQLLRQQMGGYLPVPVVPALQNAVNPELNKLVHLLANGDNWFENYQYGKARESYNECLKLNSFAKFWHDKKGKVCFNLIIANLKLNDKQGAQEAFEWAIKNDVAHFGENVDRAQKEELYFDLLDIYNGQVQKDYEKIKIICDLCLKCPLNTNQKKGVVYFNLLKCFVELNLPMNDLMKCELDWLLIEHSGVTDVVKVDIYFKLLNCYFKEKKKNWEKIDEFCGVCLKYIDSFEENEKWKVYSLLGHNYRKQEQYDKAIEAYNMSFSLAPVDSKCFACNNLAQLYLRLKRLDDAKQFLDKWLELPKSAQYEGATAHAYFELALMCRNLFLEYFKEENVISCNEVREKSLIIFEECFKMIDSYSELQKCIIYINISKIVKKDDFIKAIDYSLKAIEHIQDLDDKENKVSEMKKAAKDHYESFGSSVVIVKKIAEEMGKSTDEEEIKRLVSIIAKIYELKLI